MTKSPFPTGLLERMPSRRSFVGGLIAGALPYGSLPVNSGDRGSSEPRKESATRFAEWSPGLLDIHHISTGRGNATFIILPDGTTILFDAGALRATAEEERFIIAQYPGSYVRPGQVIAAYIKNNWPKGISQSIDYFLLSHFHQDHMGGVDEGVTNLPRSKSGKYILTGVSDVHEEIPIRKIIDRGFPDYNYPSAINDRHQLNYRAFIEEFVRSGGEVEKVKIGSANQIRPLRSTISDCRLVNLAANGEVWNEKSGQLKATFPDLTTLPMELFPVENKCSVAIRLDYGPFSYYSGGDLESSTRFGTQPWGDIETQVAIACGPVEVAVANHHGYAGSCGPEWIRKLQPRNIVIFAWDSAHPAITPLENMLSQDLLPKARNVFATAIKEENRIANRRISELASSAGHTVVRVEQGGGQYSIYVRDQVTMSDEPDMLPVSGPFRCLG